MIQFSCPSCKQSLEVIDQGAGMQVPCPKCGTGLTIPRVGHLDSHVRDPQRAASKGSVSASSSKLADQANQLQVSSATPNVPPALRAGWICLCAATAASLITLIVAQAQVNEVLTRFKSLLDQVAQLQYQPGYDLAQMQAQLLRSATPIDPFPAGDPMLHVLAVAALVFFAAAFLCAIVAMCTIDVNKGLILLGVAVVAYGFIYWRESSLSRDAAQQANVIVQDMVQQMTGNAMQQVQEIQKQMLRFSQPPVQPQRQ